MSSASTPVEAWAYLKTKNMPKISINIGTILGIAAYFALGRASLNAMIPCILGFLLPIFGLLGR